MSTNSPDNSPGTLPADVAQSASEPAAVNQSQQAKAPKTASEWLFEAIKEIPFAGPWIVWLIKQFGWKGLILFGSGAIITAVVLIILLYTGKLPSALVSETYRAASVSSPSPTPAPWQGALPMVEMDDLSAMPLLADYYSYVLSSIADSMERGAVKAFKLKDHLPRDTGESKWFIDLKSDKNYEIKSGRAFRVTSVGLGPKEAELIQSLTTDDSLTHFKLPPCHKGDTLIVIIVYQQRQQPADDAPPEFQSFAP